MCQVNDDTLIAMRCNRCGSVGAWEYQDRALAACPNCLRNKSIVVKPRTMMKEAVHPHDPVYPDHHMTWDEYQELQKK